MLQTLGCLSALNGTNQPSQARSSFHSSFDFPFRRKDSRWMQGFFAQPVSSSVLGRPGEKDLLGRLKGMERKVTPVSPCVSSQLWQVQGPSASVQDDLWHSRLFVRIHASHLSILCVLYELTTVHLAHSPPPLHLPCLLERHKLKVELSLFCCGNELCAPEFGYWLQSSKGSCSDTEVCLSSFWYYWDKWSTAFSSLWNS